MRWVSGTPHVCIGSLLLAVLLFGASYRIMAQSPDFSGVPGTPGSSVDAHVHQDSIVPGSRTFLEPNAPNPFPGSTTIGYSLAEDGPVLLKVYDFFYREIETLVDANQTAGKRYVVTFIPRGLPSGMYFYELRTNRGRELKRMIYMK
jgi:hypothetical protein